jgi:RNA polymerase sigma-70 factor, ECF subfamily
MQKSAGEGKRVDRGGSKEEQEARQLFDRYVESLLALARRRISQRLASRVDPEDVVQSVFRTFFAQLKAGRYRFEQQDDLCKLLMRITVHKTLRHIAFHEADKRSPRLEVGQEDEAQKRILELLDHEPTPETTVTFLDQLEHFLSRLRPEERQVVEMRLQGYTNEEIATRLGTYDRKIRRVVERIRSLAEKEGISPLGP